MNIKRLLNVAVFMLAALPSSLVAQAVPPLPSGNTGLAASYPNDAGINTNASVVFADGYETYTSANQFTGSGNYTNFFQQNNFAIDASTVFSGTKSIRIRMPQSGGEVSNGLMKDLSTERDTLFMRVYTRFQPNFGGVNSAHSSLWVSGNYTGPGRRPNGNDFFLVLMENSKWVSAEPEPGWTHAYVYHPEQDDSYGEHWYSDGSTSNGSQNFGPNFVPIPKRAPTRGVWICYEMMVQLNTPGQRNGRVAFWQDGVLIGDWVNLRFRDVATVKIDQIALENGGQASSQVNDRWYDNLVVATSYIGPMSTGGTPPAPQPTSASSFSDYLEKMLARQFAPGRELTSEPNSVFLPEGSVGMGGGRLSRWR